MDPDLPLSVPVWCHVIDATQEDDGFTSALLTVLAWDGRQRLRWDGPASPIGWWSARRDLSHPSLVRVAIGDRPEVVVWWPEETHPPW